LPDGALGSLFCLDCATSFWAWFDTTCNSGRCQQWANRKQPVNGASTHLGRPLQVLELLLKVLTSLAQAVHSHDEGAVGALDFLGSDLA
jgi:hypothetical protein